MVQDPAQAAVVKFAGFPAGCSVWDACAAPGGKSLVLAQRHHVLASDVLCRVEAAGPVTGGDLSVLAGPRSAREVSTGATRGRGVPAVRLGLGYVLGVREADVHGIVEERERGGRFTSLADLAARCSCSIPSLEYVSSPSDCGRKPMKTA